MSGTTIAGRAIAALRAEKGWSLRDLAEIAGIPLKRVWRIESGEAKLTRESDLIAIASALGVTIFDLYREAA